jgi:DNA-binding NarL/FixJ family response regulator
MKIAIIEDHKMVAESLKKVLALRVDPENIRLFKSGETFLSSRSPDWQPQLIISDILMPGKNGADLIKDYRAGQPPGLKIIILTSISNIQTLKYTLKQGANGYLNKEEPVEELLTAIERVMAGEEYVGQSLRSRLIRNLLVGQEVNYHLSPREKDVLRLICSGRIIKEVASELGLSVNTVQGYHKNIMHKFNVKRTPDLIIEAIRSGFYNPDIQDSQQAI